MEMFRPVEVPEHGVLQGYFVSDEGRIESKRRGKDTIMSLMTTKSGHKRLTLSVSDPNDEYNSANFLVHRLVAFAFPERVRGKYKEGYEVHHLNHRPWDNRPENLQWISLVEHRKLTHKSGHGSGKYLSEQEVFKLFDYCYDNPSVEVRELTRKFGHNFQAMMYGKARPELLEKYCKQKGITTQQFKRRNKDDEGSYSFFPMYHKEKMSMHKIAKKVGCSPMRVCRTLSGKTKPHLKARWEAENG